MPWQKRKGTGAPLVCRKTGQPGLSVQDDVEPTNDCAHPPEPRFNIRETEMPRPRSKPHALGRAMGLSKAKGLSKDNGQSKEKAARRGVPAKEAGAGIDQAEPSLAEVAVRPRTTSPHATGRPGARADEDRGGPETGDRLFVTALARGLGVLSAFRPGEGRLGNQELAERTGLPKPTISRITHTLTQLGYLNCNQRLSQYELGGATLSLGYAALSNLDVRRIARPFMQELADATNLTVGLALRDKLMMLCIEACQGEALVGLRLFPGSRMPIATTAMGRAYLAAVGATERTAILDEVRRDHGDEWPSIRRAIERSMKDLDERGFCVSIGDWQKDINGVGAAIPLPDGRGIYALNIGGPAYCTSPEHLITEIGPMVAGVAREIIALLGGGVPARAPPKGSMEWCGGSGRF